MMFSVAILAGGLAMRLRPITEKIPKALVEIAGQPFIVHQLKLMKKNNIEHVVLCIGYLGEMIQDSIGDGHNLGLHVDYSSDWPHLLGTGGALKKALSLLGDNFFVLYGDSYLDCNYCAVQSAFKKSAKQALMTVFRNENKWDKSNISYRGGKILKYDKKNTANDMEYIDYGLSILNTSVFDTAGFGDRFDLAELYKDLVDSGQMAGYETKERFYEIGTVQGIKELEKHLNNKEMR